MNHYRTSEATECESPSTQFIYLIQAGNRGANQATIVGGLTILHLDAQSRGRLGACTY